MAYTQTEKLFFKLLLESLKDFENGDFSTRLPTDLTGILGEIGSTFNNISSKAEKSTSVAPASKETAISGKKVLIVDDDVRSLFAMRSLLEGINMQVLYAENGQECLKTLKENVDVDVVLMDIMMPGMSGYEVMTAIRNTLQLLDLPIIVISAKSMQGERQRCLDAGASDYLSKPVNSEQLISLLKTKVGG